ncbi:MAG TPA: hypothetical protein VFH80_30165 [Solirubrobacteraceae bacterium]|nr:hypothetical protein [Solirubrobacteraceae bacterium]
MGSPASGVAGMYFTFRIDATKTSTATTFALRIYDASGALYHQAGTTKSQIPLGGGTIVIHK